MSVRKRDTRNLLEDYAGMGGRTAFDLKGGRHCEGYVVEVNGDHLLFGHGGPLAPEEPERIPLETSTWGASRSGTRSGGAGWTLAGTSPTGAG